MHKSKIKQEVTKTVKDGKNQKSMKLIKSVTNPEKKIILAASLFAKFQIFELAIALLVLYPRPQPIFLGGYLKATLPNIEKNKPIDMATKKSIKY